MRCLAKDAKDRPQTARELAEQYEHALTSAQTAPPPAPVYDPPAGDGGDPFSPDKAFATSWITPQDDPCALLFDLEAWMPESVALVKLRGYVHDFRGEVVESVPGLIRVRLPGTWDEAVKGRLSWLGLIRKPAPILLELRLLQNDPARPNLLQVAALFRSTDGTPAHDPHWRARCVKHYIDLRGYLIGLTEAVT